MYSCISKRGPWYTDGNDGGSSGGCHVIAKRGPWYTDGNDGGSSGGCHYVIGWLGEMT